MNMHSPIDIDTRSASPLVRWRKRHVSLGVIALALIGGVTWKLLDRPEAQAAATPLVTVGISAPLTRAVTQWDEYVGRFAPSQTVEIRPRVSGSVNDIHFRDGNYVKPGQLRFTAVATAGARAKRTFFSWWTVMGVSTGPSFSRCTPTPRPPRRARTPWR